MSNPCPPDHSHRHNLQVHICSFLTGVYTPLFNAAWSGHFDICKLILDSLNDINPAKNNVTRQQLLSMAVQGGFLKICRSILKDMEDTNDPKRPIKRKRTQ